MKCALGGFIGLSHSHKYAYCQSLLHTPWGLWIVDTGVKYSGYGEKVFVFLLNCWVTIKLLLLLLLSVYDFSIMCTVAVVSVSVAIYTIDATHAIVYKPLLKSSLYI